jgi:ferritin-like metal-binding protein YciE
VELNSVQELYLTELEVYLTELKDLYDAEQCILKALPKMAEAANSPDLRSAFQGHLAQSQCHVDRLEQIFQKMDEAPKGQKCKGIIGIIDEGEDMMDESAAPAAADAALIAAAQRVEHYESSAYGAAHTFARRLGYEDHVQLLNQTLQEEGIKS